MGQTGIASVGAEASFTPNKFHKSPMVDVSPALLQAISLFSSIGEARDRIGTSVWGEQ